MECTFHIARGTWKAIELMKCLTCPNYNTISKEIARSQQLGCFFSQINIAHNIDQTSRHPFLRKIIWWPKSFISWNMPYIIQPFNNVSFETTGNMITMQISYNLLSIHVMKEHTYMKGLELWTFCDLRWWRCWFRLQIYVSNLANLTLKSIT